MQKKSRKVENHVKNGIHWDKFSGVDEQNCILTTSILKFQKIIKLNFQ